MYYLTYNLMKVNRTHMQILDVAIFYRISPDVCNSSIAPSFDNLFCECTLMFNYDWNFLK